MEATVDGRNPAPLGNHGKPLLVGICREAILLGFARCRISSAQYHLRVRRNGRRPPRSGQCPSSPGRWSRLAAPRQRWSKTPLRRHARERHAWGVEAEPSACFQKSRGFPFRECVFDSGGGPPRQLKAPFAKRPPDFVRFATGRPPVDWNWAKRSRWSWQAFGGEPGSGLVFVSVVFLFVWPDVV